MQRLDADNVPYQLKGDGAEILVPQDQVTKLRVALARGGIPPGGVLPKQGRIVHVRRQSGHPHT